MKISINIQNLAVNKNEYRGIPVYISNLIKELVIHNKNEYELAVFDYKKERGNRLKAMEFLPGIEIPIYENANVSYRELMYDRPARYRYETLFEDTYDLFHFPWDMNVPNCIQTTCVLTSHDIIPILPKFDKLFSTEIKHRYICTYDRIAQMSNSILLADSQCTKNDIINHFNISEDRIIVTPLAYDKDMFVPKYDKEILVNMNIMEPYILYLGAVEPRKGVDVLLKAYEKVQNKEIKLVIAGNVKKEQYDVIKQIEEINKGKERIIVTGYVSEIQKQALLAGAELFVFPTRYEGFGLPVLEAMACGTPVITTNVSSIPEVGGDAVVYCDDENSEQLAWEIDCLLDNRELRESYSQKGLERCKQFSWSKTAELTENAYKMAYERFC